MHEELVDVQNVLHHMVATGKLQRRESDLLLESARRMPPGMGGPRQVARDIIARKGLGPGLRNAHHATPQNF